MMLPGVIPAVDAHYVEMQRLEAMAVLASRRSWAAVDPDRISESWVPSLRRLAPAFSNVQRLAAIAGANYIGNSLRQQGSRVDPLGAVRPDAFAGWSSQGQPIERVLSSPAYRVKQWIGEGHTVDDAMASGGRLLDTIARSEIADAGRSAAGVDVAVRPDVGYVRMLNPPSCPDCLIQAGRWFRYSTGFERHPNCDCVHVPAQENVAGDLTTDPRAYFDSLDESEQDRLFGRDNAQAIRDGADIAQVRNRDLRGPGASFVAPGAKLTPEMIYSRAGSRAEAIRLLELNGYIFTR